MGRVNRDERAETRTDERDRCRGGLRNGIRYLIEHARHGQRFECWKVEVGTVKSDTTRVELGGELARFRRGR